MKTVYVMRHGHDECGLLSDHGAAQVEAAGEALKKELEGIDQIVIYHSPITRAAETAHVLADVLKPIDVKLESEEDLKLEHYSVDRVVNRAEDNSIIVSHQPDIAEYVNKSLKNAEYVVVRK